MCQQAIDAIRSLLRLARYRPTHERAHHEGKYRKNESYGHIEYAPPFRKCGRVFREARDRGESRRKDEYRCRRDRNPTAPERTRRSGLRC